MHSDNITFRFKHFAVTDSRCGMKLGTDGVIAGALALKDDFSEVDRINIADIGAGCGIISLMIAQRFPQATIKAIEIDNGACMDLSDNIKNSPWAERIDFVEGDFLTDNGIYNAIISNPPYYYDGEVAPSTIRAKARHVGTLSPIALLDYADSHMYHDGILAMIVPSQSANNIISESIFKRFALIRRYDITTSKRRGITRSFLEFSKNISIIPQLSVINIDSSEFRELTHDFYLNT